MSSCSQATGRGRGAGLGGLVEVAPDGAQYLLRETPTAAGMFEDDRWSVRGGPPIAPMGEGDDDGLKVTAFVGQQVFVVRCIAAPLHQTSSDKAVEPGGQDVRRYAQVSLKVGEAGGPAERRVTDDQQAPAFADRLQGACC